MLFQEKVSASPSETLVLLSMTLRETANGKNETFAVRLQLFEHWSENICICGK